MIRDEVLKLAEECSAKHAARVIDVSLRGSNQKVIVEIFVDAESGVTTELCSKISRDFGDSLAARDLIGKSYQLIVSSPGIERGLKFPWQYKKHIGRNLSIRTDAGLQSGKLLSVDSDGLKLEVGNEELQLSFVSIQEAIVQAPW